MQINTLITDIYSLLPRKDGWFNEELSSRLSGDIATRLAGQLGVQDGSDRPTLRMSRLGPQCPCALWHSIHHPELREALPPWAEIKFTFGHILEALAIALAKAAGHEVTGEQDELVLDGITGHRDCVIDGCVVDVKSCSSRMFTKFKDKYIGQDDPFGYLYQLDAYIVGSAADPVVTTKDRGYILAIDKTLGHMVLYEHTVRKESIIRRIADHKHVVGLPTAPPCTCETVSKGESGNIRLGTRASYSAYKHCCFPKLRTAIYSDGPQYFVKVVKWPTNQYGPLPEVDRYGKIVYN